MNELSRPVFEFGDCSRPMRTLISFPDVPIDACISCSQQNIDQLLIDELQVSSFKAKQEVQIMLSFILVGMILPIAAATVALLLAYRRRLLFKASRHMQKEGSSLTPSISSGALSVSIPKHPLHPSPAAVSKDLGACEYERINTDNSRLSSRSSDESGVYSLRSNDSEIIWSDTSSEPCDLMKERIDEEEL